MSKPLRGLPPVDKSLTQENRLAIDIARTCPYCKSAKGVRIVSNGYGVNAICGPCKRHWPISAAPLAPQMPESLPRGLHKQTLVEPNWDKAYDELEGDATNEQIGPKKR
jgi:hypothetical protein